ncbi:DUF2852 domain-containing protein [Beijerinckia mobilis]|uniref:DUF2852 domain-containing protein n=1 Tax=Beijerinckia mobilis TaxID=231434 RepID=UPI0009FBFC5E|nr:DUF2852 domain-containing protein [Beijerinckia mobilis]
MSYYSGRPGDDRPSGEGSPWGTYRYESHYASHGGCANWKPAEFIAMILGFIVFWPVGLAIVGWKFWQGKSGYSGDLFSFLRDQWNRRGGLDGIACRAGFPRGFGGGFSGFGGSSGNRAFDEWRNAELARLEEERRRLAAAEREFSAFLEQLRHAKDREEFERFMRERNNGPSAA